MKMIIKNNIQLYKIYLKKEPLYCLVRIVASILGIVQPISSIYLFQLFLDAVFIGESIKKGIMIAIFTAVINLIIAILNWIVNSKLTPVSEQKNILHFTKEILEIYLHTDVEIIEDPKFYDKYTQVINDISNRIMAVQNAVCSLIGNICSLCVVVVLMLRVGPIMILVSLLGVVANLVLTPVMNKIGYASYMEKTPLQRKQDYIRRVFYIRDFIKELKIYNISKTLINENDKNGQTFIEVIQKYGNKYIMYGIVASFVQCMSFAAVLMYLAYCAVFNSWSMGYVASMYNASEELKNVIGQLFATIPLFDENSRYISNYNMLIKSNTSVIEKRLDNSDKNLCEKVGTIEKIEFRNVDFSYKNTAKKALKDINMEFTKGGKYVLVGYNGAGKSTFINLLLRLYMPQSGEILLNGKKYEDYDVDVLRRVFNVVFQDCQVYAITIAENILLRKVMTKEDEENVWKALEVVGLKSYIENLPDGINSIMTKEFTEDGIVLSGGQMQKLLLARIFVNDAQVIVLDEVTSAMDAISENEIYGEIEKFAKDKMLIYISHKLSTTKGADKIYVFNDGNIAEQGTHEQLMKLNGIYSEMFLAQAEKYGI